MSIKFFVGPFFAFLIILAVAATLSGIDYSWSNWRPASCMPANCFCETIHSGTVAQPANTWSSFGFVLIGLVVIGQSAADFRRRRTNLITSQRAYPRLCGVTLILIGLGSAFYHASLTFVGQFFDVMGMYLLASFLILYNHSRLSPLTGKNFVMVYLLINTLLAGALIQYPALRRYIFGLMILATLIPEYRLRAQKTVRIDSRFLQAAWGTMILAFAVWVADLTRVLCNPNSWLQGHALWHLLGATAGGFVFLYYRSENVDISRKDAPKR